MGEIRDIINQTLDKQDAKGMRTYRQTLDDCPDGAYDWNVMALEEALDGWQYQVKENILLRKQLRKEIDRRVHAERLLKKLTRGELNEAFSTNRISY